MMKRTTRVLCILTAMLLFACGQISSPASTPHAQEETPKSQPAAASFESQEFTPSAAPTPDRLIGFFNPDFESVFRSLYGFDNKDIHRSDILAITSLDFRYHGDCIYDLSDLEMFQNLTELNLEGCTYVSDLSPLSTLTQLTKLNLE